MTNEELAVLAKTDQAALMELWKQNKGITHKVINRYRGFLDRNCAFDYEDLEQIAFEAFQEAVARFDESRGPFLHIFKLCLSNKIRRGLGIERKKSIENIVWLLPFDTPAPGGDDGSLTLADKLKDWDAVDPEEAALLDGMRADVRKAVERLPVKQSDIVKGYYFDGSTLRESADKVGVSPEWARHLLQRARRKLSRDPVLREYRPNYYRTKSVSKFLSSWSSVTEEEALRKIEWERHNRR